MMGDTSLIPPEIEAAASLWGRKGQFSLVLSWGPDSGCSEPVVRLSETVGGRPMSGGFYGLMLFTLEATVLAHCFLPAPGGPEQLQATGITRRGDRTLSAGEVFSWNYRVLLMLKGEECGFIFPDIRAPEKGLSSLGLGAGVSTTGKLPVDSFNRNH
ncbi:hypothetical protein HJG60_009493 [Phyllostomus discolor]|uniref:Uncharacterized protein n=1 Tax=Phyllostomus discolor TaxID=89673 RepID=A0A833YKY2_9CHIR|nr:hypothetical protein HJG60_009493 [Phyllostomus discolor]